jgi:hypothetical protein
MLHMSENIGPKFYDWSVSATGEWGDEELSWLRDENPELMVESLWDAGISVQSFALFELVAHGNYQKAATLARALIKAHPVCEKFIKEGCGEEMSRLLLGADLLKLPANSRQVK